MTSLLPPTVSAVLRQSHTDEVTEIIDTDAHVIATIDWCIAQIELCQRTLPGERYANLIESLRVAKHDDMPAAREELDDPFM